MLLKSLAGACALVACLATAPASVPLTDAERAADARYTAVRDAVTALKPAPIVAYAVEVRYTIGSRRTIETYDSIARAAGHAISPTYSPREDAAHPYVPHGINVGISFSVNGAPVGGVTLNPEFFEPFGVPVLSPLYAFGLARANDRPQPVASAQAGVIGTTRAVARDYAVADLGAEGCAHAPCAHLRLVPLRDPRRLRVRDLWIDPLTSLPQRAIVQGNFDRGPMDGTRWEITFAVTPLGLTIVSERSLETFDVDGRTIENAEIRFTELQRVDDIGIWHIRMLGIGGTRGETLREPEEK